MKKKKRNKAKNYVDIPILLPKETIAFIDALTAQGILGTTRNEVALHILKQAMFETVQKTTAKVKPPS